MKEQIGTILLEMVKKQGLSFIILSCVTYFFYTQLEDVKTEFRNCNNELIKLHDVNNKEMRELIIRNTTAFENFKNEK